MQDTAEDYRRYLDPRVLARITGLELRARLVVEGFYSGTHRSPQRGLSVEFADHRAYSQGDDIRRIDWKVFAKTDKYYVKQYRQETNLEVILVLDASESMGFRSDDAPMSRYDYAASVAASLCYLALRQHDSVGLAVFDDRLRQFIRPSNHPHHWKTIIGELSGKSGPAKTSIERVAVELAERLTHRSLLIFVSDFFDDVDTILAGLKRLKYHRHESVFFQLLDPAEATFPWKGPVLFEGMEQAGQLLVEPDALRMDYLAALDRFTERLRAGCSRLQTDYSLFRTDAPLDSALSGYLATRSTRLRGRSSRIMGGG